MMPPKSCDVGRGGATTVRVIKNINNNVSLCLDNDRNEVVAFGKGIGFKKPPYELDISQIDRTFYHVDQTYTRMINDIPEQILDISARVIDYARTKLENPLSSNIVFTLADHLSFALRRYRENMNLKLPIVYDVQYLFRVEMQIGWKALALVEREMKVRLPQEEAAYVALHIINAETNKRGKKTKPDEEIISEITEIIERDLSIRVDKDGFNYSRFVTHMHYLLCRGKNKEFVESENRILYEQMKETFPEIYQCARKICRPLSGSLSAWSTPAASVISRPVPSPTS